MTFKNLLLLACTASLTLAWYTVDAQCQNIVSNNEIQFDVRGWIESYQTGNDNTFYRKLTLFPSATPKLDNDPEVIMHFVSNMETLPKPSMDRRRIEIWYAMDAYQDMRNLLSVNRYKVCFAYKQENGASIAELRSYIQAR